MLKTVAMIFIMFLSACASDPVSLSKSAEDDYLKGKNYVVKKEYAKAIMFFEHFTAKYPYSQYTADAELLRLKAAYFDSQFVLSETLGLRFIEAHPDHAERVYAQYLVAMSYYRQSSSAMLDQQFSHKSLEAFRELNRLYPDNPYTKDIKKYLQILTDRVAEHEMIVGKYYFDKHLYVAAINRFTLVKNSYLDAKVAAETLYYLASAYKSLNQTGYVTEISNLLQQKFPQSKWAKKAAELK